MDTISSRALRTPGWAALIVGLAFLPQPFLIFLLPAPDGSEFLPPGSLDVLALRSTVQAIVWGVYPSAMIVLVVATSRLASDRLWPRVATVFGLIGSAGWLAESALRLAPMSQPAGHLGAAPVPPETQGTILYALDIVLFGTMALGFIGVSVWLIGVGTARMLPLSRVLRVLRVLLVLVGAVTIVLFYVLPALPLSAFAVYALLIAIGIELLIRSRWSTRIGESSGKATTAQSITID